jgi:hypothetical protein
MAGLVPAILFFGDTLHLLTFARLDRAILFTAAKKDCPGQAGAR